MHRLPSIHLRTVAALRKRAPPPRSAPLPANPAPPAGPVPSYFERLRWLFGCGRH